MKFAKWLLISIACLLGLFFVISFFLPTDYYLERSVEIEAPAALIYSQVADLEAWQEWNPWNDADPDMVISYGETTVGEGALYSWESVVAGNGMMRITKAVAPEYADFELIFEGYETTPSYSTISLAYEDPLGPTMVTWTFEGDVGDKLFARWMGVLMDKFVGASYEKGLMALKEQCEGMEVTLPEL